MAHKEACQLYIEQEIKEGLKQGKTPYSIGKDLAAWVEKLFETSIPARTIEQKARRTQNATNVATATTPQNPSQIPQKQQSQPVTASTPGPGRLPKYVLPPSDAMYFVAIAIAQLERIANDDPMRDEALDKVIKWIDKNRIRNRRRQ